MSTPPTWARPEPVRPGLPGDVGFEPDEPASGDPYGAVLRPGRGDPYAAPQAPSASPGLAVPRSPSGYLALTYPAGGYLPQEEPVGYAFAPPPAAYGYGPASLHAPDQPVAYGHPQAPAYGYGPPPAYGYPSPAGYGPVWGAAPPATDGMAIASLATALGGLLIFMGLPGIVAVGLGMAALRRIARTGTQGRGLAIAGIVVGGLSTLFLALMVFAILMDPEMGF